MRTDAILGRLMLAFDGDELPPAMARRLVERPPAGVTLFRAANVRSPASLRALTAAIQGCAPPGLPLLVALDHEGGQLLGIGGATPFPGNMALGAAGDPGLAERVGAAMGAELRAVGVNVDYAPVADLATQPANPALGVRSFGDDPGRAAPLVAGFVRGLRSAGVAATVKHFPGLGEAAHDPHHLLPRLDGSAERFDLVELEPFRAGIEAGAELVMSAHVAAPALTGRADLPATLSSRVMVDLLRSRLGFDGVTISDAFDMAALRQGPAQLVEALAAMRAGVDLLLLTARSDPDGRLADALVFAGARGLLAEDETVAARARVEALRARLAATDPGPGPEIVGSASHGRLADEVAARSLTLVRDEPGMLPLAVGDHASIAVVMPKPTDLTPADTSGMLPAGLAEAMRRHHAGITECHVSHAPTDDEIVAARELVASHDLAIVGTTAATLVPAQAALVAALLTTSTPLVAVALRMPWDVSACAGARTQLCTYSLVEPSMRALAAGLFGRAGFPGRLPVGLGGEARA